MMKREKPPTIHKVKKPNRNKPLYIVGGLVLAFILAITTTYFILQAFPNVQTTAHKYYVYGGYAIEAEDVDEHLITLLSEQGQIAEQLNSTYDVKGIFVGNHVQSAPIGEAQLNVSTPVKVDISWDTYLDATTTDLRSVQELIGNYLTENGYEVLEGDTIYDDALTLQREVKVTNVSTGEETTKAEIATLFYPEDYVEQGYYLVHIEMFSNITYPLGVVPTWSGILRDDEQQKQWGWIQDDPTDETLCAVKENTVIGFWDQNYECLQSIVDPGIFFEDHDHSEHEGEEHTEDEDH